MHLARKIDQRIDQPRRIGLQILQRAIHRLPVLRAQRHHHHALRAFCGLRQIDFDHRRGLTIAPYHLPAQQFHALINAQSGVSDAVVESAFPIDGAQLADVVATLERRFGRKLNATVEVKPELIGGIRVIVGDEVLDTSVQARLQQMKVALTA